MCFTKESIWMIYINSKSNLLSSADSTVCQSEEDSAQRLHWAQCSTACQVTNIY